MKSKRKNLFANVGNQQFKGGKSLSSVDLKIAADSVNNILGKGNQVFLASPDCSEFPFLEDDHSIQSSSYEFKFRISPSATAIERQWNFNFTSFSSSNCLFSFDNDANYQNLSYSVNATPITITVNEFVSGYSTDLSGTTEKSMKMIISGSVFNPTTDDKYGWRPLDWSCFEIDRPAFDPITSSLEGGIDVDSFSIGTSIYDAGTNQYSSIPAIARNVKLAQKKTKRTNLFTWIQPYNPLIDNSFSYESIVSSSTANQFETFIKTTCVASPRYRNETTASLKLFLLGGITGSSTNFAADIDVLTAFGTSSIKLTSSNADHRDLTSWKVWDIPVYRLNLSSSNGFGFGDQIESTYKVTINARLSGNYTNSNDRFIPFTIQLFDPIEE